MRNFLDTNTIPPVTLSLIAALVSILITDDLDADQLNVLGNFIVAVGSLLLTIAAQQASINSKETVRLKNYLP